MTSGGQMGVPQEQQRAKRKTEAGEMTESQRRWRKRWERKRPSSGDKGLRAELWHFCPGCSADLGLGGGERGSQCYRSSCTTGHLIHGGVLVLRGFTQALRIDLSTHENVYFRRYYKAGMKSDFF